MIFGRGTVAVPANAEVQRQARTEFPIVLNKRVPVVVRVVAIGTGLCTGARVNRGLLKIGVIVLEISMWFLGGRDAGNRTVRLQHSI